MIIKSQRVGFKAVKEEVWLKKKARYLKALPGLWAVKSPRPAPSVKRRAGLGYFF
jgi:hypothetical protein